MEERENTKISISKIMNEWQNWSQDWGPTSGSTTRSVPISHSITGPLARSIGPGFRGGERGKALTNPGGLSGPPLGVHFKFKWHSRIAWVGLVRR
jgi:hypothetical protein